MRFVLESHWIDGATTERIFAQAGMIRLVGFRRLIAHSTRIDYQLSLGAERRRLDFRNEGVCI